MRYEGSDFLRELIRLFVRNIGILEKTDSCCCGITLTQCHAIVEIGRQGEISLNDLAKILTLDKSTMSRTINNLVDDRLVIRELHRPDRRYISIKLTENGDKVFRQIEESMGKYYSCIFSSIPEDKREQVLESLKLLIKAVSDNKCC